MNNKKWILVVEDEFISAMEIVDTLKKVGYLPTNNISTGKKALEIIQEKHPDMLVLDVNLNDNISGIEVARQAKKLDIPFIFVTAYSESSVMKEMRELEPVDIIIKPFIQKNLINTVNNYFS